jgi:tape measure domain-containing protein
VAVRKASIAAQLTADRTKWTSDLAKATAEGRKFASDIGSIKAEPGFVKSMMSGAGQVIGKYQHLRGVVTDLAGLAVRAAGAPAMYADMIDGLTAVTGSAEEAKQAMDFLGGVAEEQKLEFEPLVEAYQRMRALGYSAEQTRDLIREMGNVIEASGADVESLTQVVGALSKISDKGDVAAKSLMRMGEALPALRAIFEEQFGARTAADIDKLSLSSQELFDGIIRGLKGVETAQGGVLDAASPEYLASIARLRAGRASQGQLPIIPNLQERQVNKEDPARSAARIGIMQERTLAAGKVEMERQEQIAKVSAQLEEVKAKGDADAIAAKEDELALMEEMQDLVSKYKVDEQTATEFIVRRNQARREEAETLKTIADIQKRTEQEKEGAKAVGDTAEEIAITELRARGKTKRADKMERERSRRQHEESLIASGVDPATARAASERQARAREDLEFFERTGRSKIRGAVSDRREGGLGGGLGRGGGFLNPSALATSDPDRDIANERAALQQKTRGTATGNERVEAILIDIKAALLANKPSVAEKTKPRPN